MNNLDFIEKLTFKIAEVGAKKCNEANFYLNKIEPFQHFFDQAGNLKINELNKIDGAWTRREVLTRFLLLSSVLEQGPDIVGVRELLKNVVNTLYRKEIRIIHRPLDFFKELNISINEILEKHNSIKRIRAEDWARANKTSSKKYNLFFAQSQRGIIPINQVLDYGVHRWGVPLCVFLLLEKDISSRINSTQPFVEYLHSFDSAEIASRQIKSHERYGLGSAIGDKACHLFVKSYIHTYSLSYSNEKSWSQWSYEFPLDSNAGRVLLRSGFLLSIANLEEYKKMGIIKEGAGKKDTHYLRATNIRGMKIFLKDKKIMDNYEDILLNHLKIKKRKPEAIEIQHIPNAILYNSEFGIGTFDDGLIFIGTQYCFNHENPNCDECPLNRICHAHNEDKSLIENYTT